MTGLTPVQFLQSVKSNGEKRDDLSGIPPDDTLQMQLKEMTQVPLLKAGEEVTLAKQYERGSEAAKRLREAPANPEEVAILQKQVREGNQAREQLVVANGRLVVSIATKYRGYGVPFSDLIQGGTLGLLRAVEKFNYRRGVKFATYATWWIRQGVQRTQADQSRTIRLPVHVYERVRLVNKSSMEYIQVHGKQPSPKELADRIERLSPKQVKEVQDKSQWTLSLEEPVGAEGRVGDFIENERTSNPDQVIFCGQLQDKIRDVLNTLTAREGRIMELRFGLRDGRQYTLVEVGEKFGLTGERIRQIEKEALGKLRQPGRSRELQSFYEG